MSVHEPEFLDDRVGKLKEFLFLGFTMLLVKFATLTTHLKEGSTKNNMNHEYNSFCKELNAELGPELANIAIIWDVLGILNFLGDQGQVSGQANIKRTPKKLVLTN